MKINNYSYSKSSFIMTADVYEQIRKTIGTRQPEQGGILGSSDGRHIDHYYFDESARRSTSSYTMDVKALNKVIHRWNDKDILLIGVIHSHPKGLTKPSYGDLETARHIIETIDVKGKFFTPIVQVSSELNGDIQIYPYIFEQTIELKEPLFTIQEVCPRLNDVSKKSTDVRKSGDDKHSADTGRNDDGGNIQHRNTELIHTSRFKRIV